MEILGKMCVETRDRSVVKVHIILDINYHPKGHIKGAANSF